MKRFLSILLILILFGGIFFYFSSDTEAPNLEAVSSLDTIQNVIEENIDSDITNSLFEFSPISIPYLREQTLEDTDIAIEEDLNSTASYNRYIASYISEGNKIYGLLTVPKTSPPENGFKAIVFNHGYIPPNQYSTTERYDAYVDYLARNNFVVFKIDMRGHGKSEGIPSGSYFSPAYTFDALYALKALQKLDYVNANSIGMWGHSMSGNLILRAMLVSDEVKAGVIWGGAVYSYEDYSKYRISDTSYVRQPRTSEEQEKIDDRRVNPERISQLREDPEGIDFSDSFWSAISLTQNLQFLNAPVQLHHSINDNVVNIGYSRDLATALENAQKEYEFYEYQGGGHNIESPYFEQAMRRTVDFFNENL